MQQHDHDHGHSHGPRPMQGPGPDAKARIEAMKRQFAQKKRISERLAKIKNKVAVYSGKGGVGKSTVAVNLAVLLAQRGKAVGLLDADIDCPNCLKLLKADSQPDVIDGQITPAVMHGVKVVSMASFQRNEEEAIIFRGPMIHNALTQFIEVTDWGDLDYLIIDMPPGTSDAALTVMQTLQLDGFIIVTTPQELAILDAKRSINMIKKLNVKVLGVVENMAGDIFGKGGGEKLAKEAGVPFLGSIELRSAFREPPKPVALVDKSARRELDAVLDHLKTPQVV
ncbi:MAG: Mrp/NBP35 family ATP-binding protein [Chloroflexi bacterium]|nr:Mrp/NBP35 family ATP-binding protein [Chloroflexota bacterium]